MIISADKLADEITKILDEWEGVTVEAASAGLNKTAKEAVSQLHEANPSGSGKYGSWEKYNMSWDSKRADSKKGGFGVVIYNKKHYQLTHLLENGHALANGGRAQAFPHIAPVAEEAERNLLENVKRYINQN